MHAPFHPLALVNSAPAAESEAVFFVQHLPVVEFVSRDDICRRAHTHGVAVGDSLPQPGFFAKPLEHQDVAVAHGIKLLQ